MRVRKNWWMYAYLSKDNVIHETEKAYLFKIPKSGYAGYQFWFPKKLTKVLRAKDQVKIKAFFSYDMNVYIKKFNLPTFYVPVAFAFDCIEHPELHSNFYDNPEDIQVIKDCSW